jgi:hypothetical protein
MDLPAASENRSRRCRIIRIRRKPSKQKIIAASTTEVLPSVTEVATAHTPHIDFSMDEEHTPSCPRVSRRLAVFHSVLIPPVVFGFSPRKRTCHKCIMGFIRFCPAALIFGCWRNSLNALLGSSTLMTSEIRRERFLKSEAVACT